jgi:hypothetical protein
MSRRLTDAELAEPDVVLTIDRDRYDSEVSAELDLALRTYAQRRSRGRDLLFTVPAYRYREEIAPLVEAQVSSKELR